MTDTQPQILTFEQRLAVADVFAHRGVGTGYDWGLLGMDDALEIVDEIATSEDQDVLDALIAIVMAKQAGPSIMANALAAAGHLKPGFDFDPAPDGGTS